MIRRISYPTKVQDGRFPGTIPRRRYDDAVLDSVFYSDGDNRVSIDPVGLGTGPDERNDEATLAQALRAPVDGLHVVNAAVTSKNSQGAARYRREAALGAQGLIIQVAIDGEVRHFEVLQRSDTCGATLLRHDGSSDRVIMLLDQSIVDFDNTSARA